MSLNLSQAVQDVIAERRRQIDVEGFSAQHDDCHAREELAIAAACYADPDPTYSLDPRINVPWKWPWDRAWWKPRGHNKNHRGNLRPIAGRRHDLVRAAALIIAEIERLDRLEARGSA